MNKVNETLDYIYNTIDIGDIRLSEGYYYNSIVFCIIDAVYSIGSRYASTKYVNGTGVLTHQNNNLQFQCLYDSG